MVDSIIMFGNWISLFHIVSTTFPVNCLRCTRQIGQTHVLTNSCTLSIDLYVHLLTAYRCINMGDSIRIVAYDSSLLSLYMNICQNVHKKDLTFSSARRSSCNVRQCNSPHALVLRKEGYCILSVYTVYPQERQERVHDASILRVHSPYGGLKGECMVSDGGVGRGERQLIASYSATAQ